jgi:hypothetical protein
MTIHSNSMVATRVLGWAEVVVAGLAMLVAFLVDGITSNTGSKRSPWWDAGSLLWTTPFNRCNFCHGSRRSAHPHTPVALVGSCPACGHLCFPVRVLVVGP